MFFEQGDNMKRITRIALALGALALFVAAVGCGGGKTVTRMDPTTQTDLSGRWNDTDARLVAQEMVPDALNRPWLTDWLTSKGAKPIVTVGGIRNNSSEHIDTDAFTTDFERELLNSGKVRFVARKTQRDEVRDERMDQSEWASKETMKEIRNETGADFVLVGSIQSITDQEGKNSTIFYQTNFELINIETNEKVWIGQKEIKKGISLSGKKW